MGIKIEFNPDLALRNILEYKKGKRKIEECVPEKLKVGKIYNFLKKEQRIYWFEGEVSLIETTTRGGMFSGPRASVKILEVTHFMQDGEVWTKGRYEIKEIFETNKREIFEKCRMTKNNKNR